MFSLLPKAALKAIRDVCRKRLEPSLWESFRTNGLSKTERNLDKQLLVVFVEKKETQTKAQQILDFVRRKK